ncbi:MAG TPA: response regulator [Blastocatellia bacterium]|nr:response regulator [Blastocatellia bacterium]
MVTTRIPGEKILVVEDDPDTREMVKAFFVSEGYQVETAANGRKAIEYLKSSETPCLILLDLMMPEMNGIEFLQSRRQESELSGIPVVVVTAVQEACKGARALGAIDCLSKPFEFHQLLDLARRYC